MKERLTHVLIFLIAVIGILQGQIEFAPIGAEYYYWGEYQENNSGQFIPYISAMKVLSDTVLNGQACKKISIDPRLEWGCNSVSDGVIYTYALEGEVYWWNEVDENFELLYDFKKEAGESWEVSNYCLEDNSICVNSSFTMIVDSVSYMEINGLLIKVQHITSDGANISGYNFNVYEGIGCVEHFFYWPEYFCSTAHDYFRGIRCYKSPTNGIISFYNDEGDCDMIVKSNHLEENRTISIYPNPVSNMLNIKCEGICDLELLDNQGRIIVSESNLKEDIQIDMTSRSSGLYILRLAREDELILRKVIKK